MLSNIWEQNMLVHATNTTFLYFCLIGTVVKDTIGLFSTACNTSVVLQDPTSYPACLWAWHLLSAVTLKSKLVTFTSFFLHFAHAPWSKEDYECYCCLGSPSGFLLENDSGKQRCLMSHGICWHLFAMATLGISIQQRCCKRVLNSANIGKRGLLVKIWWRLSTEW